MRGYRGSEEMKVDVFGGLDGLYWILASIAVLLTFYKVVMILYDRHEHEKQRKKERKR